MSLTKKNFIFGMIMLVIGIACIVITALGILPEGSLSSGISGMGAGFTSAGLVCSIFCYNTLKNPKKLEEAEIVEKDERNLLIREKTNSKVYSIFVYVESASILIASLLGYREIVYILAFLLIAKLIVWFFVCSSISKKN